MNCSTIQKLPTLLVVAVMLCLAFPIAASATSDPYITFTVDKTMVIPGDEVILTVSLVNNPGIVYGSFKILYDADVWEYKSFEVGSDFDIANSTYHPDWDNQVDFFGPDFGIVDSDCTLFTLVLMVKDSAVSGEKTITVRESEIGEFGLQDPDWKGISISSQSQTITVTGGADPPAPTYDITASAGAGGSISPSGKQSVTEEDSQTFTITPNDGYGIEDVKVDGDSVLSELADDEGNAKTYTFNNVTAPHTIVASFELLDKIEITLPDGADSLDFGYMKARSDVVPAAQTATVKNIGSNAVKLAAVTLSGAENSKFTVTPSWESGYELAPGESATFTMQPVANIQQAGIYTETITVTTAGGASASCSAEAKVCYILDAFCGEHGTLEYDYGIEEIDGELYITRLAKHNDSTDTCEFNVIVTPDKGYVFDTIEYITYNFAGEGRPSYYYGGKSQPFSVGGINLFCESYSGTKFHATFRLGQFAITTSVDGTGGSITPAGFTPSEEGVVSVPGLTNLVFSITPDAGYHIKDVYVDNTALAVSDYIYGTYTFPEVDADHSLIAEFAHNSYTIAFNGSGGTGTMDSLTGLEYATAKKLPVNTFNLEGYSFAGWAAEPGGEAVYNDEAEVEITTEENNATVILYAVWAGGPQVLTPTLIPVQDTAYSLGATADGIKTMTVNPGESGFKYFNIGISPDFAHSGKESLVFVHLRNGIQSGINISRADFDLVKAATAGFEVMPGDVVKVYMLDELSTALDSNPRILE